MILLDKCPVCNGKKLDSKLEVKDYTSSKKCFTIVSCETCDFTFTNPRPIDEKLGDYYKSEMYISHTNNKAGFFNWLYQTIRSYAVISKVNLLKKISKAGVHLDIGCGTGEFLNACENAGFTTKGIEPSEIARKQAIKNFKLDVSKNVDLAQFDKNSINSISMWHVLEHVPNLSKTISEFYRIVKLDGKIIIAVPNHKSWDANYYKGYWAAWDVPIHLWHFSQNTIELLFKNHGFKLLKTKPMIFDSFYVSLLSEEFKYGKKNFIKSFLIGLYANIFAIISSKGHSSTVYVFERYN